MKSLVPVQRLLWIVLLNFASNQYLRSSARWFCNGGEQRHSRERVARILIDITQIVNEDPRTGIQRFVRAIIASILKRGYNSPPILFIHSYSGQGYRQICPELNLCDEIIWRKTDVRIDANQGDVFFALDFAPLSIVTEFIRLLKWKRHGVKFYFVLHDFLPLMQSRWFEKKTARVFGAWLNAVRFLADELICVSNTVAQEANFYFAKERSTDGLVINTCLLSGELMAGGASTGVRGNVMPLLAQTGEKRTILMVGTIEPRKGYIEVLAAFNQLWTTGTDLNLVIVGKRGWMSYELVNAITTNPQINKKLFWIDDARDEELEQLYRACYAVLVASQGEGCGLPVLEAAFYGKQLLCRDLAVFREMAPEGTRFFKNQNTPGLAEIIRELLNQDQVVRSGIFSRRRWSEVADDLLKIVYSTNKLKVVG